MSYFYPLDELWRGESEAAGEAPPPASHTFSSWSAKTCHIVGTTYIWWMGALQAPQQFHGRVLVELQGSRPLEAPKICILQYLNLGLIFPNNTWMVMHFLMCIAVQSHRKIRKVQNFQFSSFLSEKNVYALYSSSWIIFLRFKRQAI